jgi:hypothetical protein
MKIFNLEESDDEFD